jgi:hypothetical protein
LERLLLVVADAWFDASYLNQPIEVPSLRPQFASFLGIGSMRPDLVLRFGRGPALPPSPRRRVQSVLA